MQSQAEEYSEACPLGWRRHNRLMESADLHEQPTASKARTAESMDARVERTPPCRLVVERGDHPGMIYSLRGSVVTVGRGPENTIQIIDTRISRFHIRFELTNGHWTLRDLQSRNGTQVNGKPIATTVRLIPGDTIQLGNTTLLFERDPESNPADTHSGSSAGVRLAPDDTGLKRSHVIEIPDEDTEKEISKVVSVPKDTEARLKSIYQVGKLIQSLLDVDELLNKVMETVCHVLQPTYACIFLRDVKHDILIPKVIHRPEGSTEELIISGTIIQQAMEDKVAVIMEDSQRDKRFKGSDSVAVQRIRSAICAPLISKGEVVGALYFDRRGAEGGYNDSDLEWAVGVANQAALGISVATLHNEMVVKHQRERELEIARSIQMNLLPKAMPKIPGFEFGGLSEPARAVGGDYFDILELPTGDIALAIADVSGKGVPSALLLASVRAALRIESRSLPEDGIIEVMSRLNEIVCQETMSNMFVTMVAGYFEPETRRLTYVNAGHVYPILRHPDGTLVNLESGGSFLGIMPGIDFEKESIKVPDGSLIVFISDGVTDALNAENEIFGNDRLLEFIEKNADMPAQAFCDKLLATVREFTGATEQFDDFTVMVLKAQ